MSDHVRKSVYVLADCFNLAAKSLSKDTLCFPTDELSKSLVKKAKEIYCSEENMRYFNISANLPLRTLSYKEENFLKSEILKAGMDILQKQEDLPSIKLESTYELAEKIYEETFTQRVQNKRITSFYENQ